MQCLDFYRGELTSFTKWRREIKWDSLQELLNRWFISISKNIKIFMKERILQIPQSKTNGENMKRRERKKKKNKNKRQKLLKSNQKKLSKRLILQSVQKKSKKKRQLQFQKLIKSSLIYLPTTEMIQGNINGPNPSTK